VPAELDPLAVGPEEASDDRLVEGADEGVDDALDDGLAEGAAEDRLLELPGARECVGDDELCGR
jgi:hypothetical protein